jgi:DNA-binding CsgD family transcriptional regulator
MSNGIVGREEELAAIMAFLTGGVWPHSLLLSGEAGMGKTTLWRAGVEAAGEDHAVLATRPLEAEAKLAYAGVGDLLAGSHAAIEELPAPQAHALRAALLLEAPVTGAVDERGVSLGFLGVLRAIARDRPVLVAVDDVQWLDRASARVLSFAARRLTDERVAFVIAVREEARSELDLAPERVFPGFAELVLRPLTLDEVHSLLQARLGLVLARPSLRAVHETARGNPFFALELAREQAATRHPGEAPPVPATLRELIGARVSALPVETRAALVAAAASGDPTLELVDAATGLDAAAALGPAVETDIVAVASGRIRFAHPLLAAAAYGGAEPGQRRDVHAALAAFVGDAEERARHLALAARGPDAEVAAALDEAAKVARGRGAPVAAAELLEEARALTPAGSRDDARRRAVEAAAHHFAAGDTRRARVLLDEALAEMPGGVERARALIVLAHVRSLDDDIRAAVELLEAAVTEAEAEPLVQAQAREMLSGIFFRLRERFADAVEHARAAVAVGRAQGNAELLGSAIGSLALAEATLGLEQARGTLDEADALGGAGRGARAMGGSEFQVAVVRMWWEELDAAKESFERILDLADSIGDESSVPYIRVLLAQTECLRGRFADAAAHADEGVVRAEQVGQETLVAYALALRALAAAYTGEEESARAAAAAALGLAGSTSGRPAEQFATAALGLLELSLERDAEAVEVLAPLVAFAREHEMREPGLTRFVPDLVEALVALRRLDEAEEHLTWFEGNAERLGRRSGQGAAARCRGFLAAARGDLAGALTAFEDALAHHDAAPIPFDRARTLLALGAARRRAKERRAARTALEDARGVFGALGARIWEQRAVAELARIGGRAPSSGELTPVERRVAELVAAGRTNKEVAAALFLSTRTVEGHLSRVYGKLGVHSRVELARKLG